MWCFFFLVDYLKHFRELALSQVKRKRGNITARELSNQRVSLTLQTPHATVHSSEVADAWFAWHSMPVETKIKHINTGEKDVHATPTTSILHYNKVVIAFIISESFVAFITSSSGKSSCFHPFCFSKIIRSKHISSHFPSSSTFLIFQSSRWQQYLAHPPVACVCFPNLKDKYFYLVPLVF